MLRPIPWPTRVRTIERPAPSTCSCIAWETSPSLLPTRHRSTADSSASSVVTSSLRATGVIGPTGNVRAASATHPSWTTPMSSEMMSPRPSLYRPGMPCTIIEFGEAQIDPGKPR